MKKLIISEVISIVLVIGIFLLVFTFFNGWEKTGQERYKAAINASFIAAIPVLITTIVFAIAALVATFIAISVGMAITAIANFKGDGASGVAIIVNALAVIAFTVLVFAAAVREYPKNTSKKIAWLSFGIEVVAIIVLIALITLN